MSGADALAAAPAPLEVHPDPLEQWLRWEEQANLVGFRVSTAAIAVPVARIARERVRVHVAAHAPERVVRRFVGQDAVAFPKHPLNRDASVPFFDEPCAHAWTARFTSSRTLAVLGGPHEPAFSVKLPTDHPHPDFVQPEKTRLREEAEDALALAALVERVDGVLGADPALGIVREVIAVLVPGSEGGFTVRDLRPLEDGSYYLPALSIPFCGPAIAARHREPFDAFWGLYYAEAVGRVKAKLLARYGLQYETPNPQNILVQLDGELRPTGRIVLRDLGDTDSLMGEIPQGERPWGRLARDVKPETRNSFWAFDGAGDMRVSDATLADWYAQHDAAYLRELSRLLGLPSAAVAPAAGDAFAALNAFLRSAEGERSVGEAWERGLAR